MTFVAPGNEPKLGRSVSIDQAAQLLGVSRRTIYNRIRDGRLQTIRTIGGSQRILVESLHNSVGVADGLSDATRRVDLAARRVTA